MAKYGCSSGFDLCTTAGGRNMEYEIYLLVCFIIWPFGLCHMADRHRESGYGWVAEIIVSVFLCFFKNYLRFVFLFVLAFHVICLVCRSL